MPTTRAARLLDHLDQEPDGLARRDQVLDDEYLAALPDEARELVGQPAPGDPGPVNPFVA